MYNCHYSLSVLLSSILWKLTCLLFYLFILGMCVASVLGMVILNFLVPSRPSKS